MRVAIVHYHLAPGGVTTVIRAASHSLTEAGISHVILTGSSPETDLPVRIIDGLDYSNDCHGETEETLAQKLRQAAHETLGAAPDLWHFHNHSLGKNTLIPGVVDLLARENERLVLQLHDLAEDGRAQNYSNIPKPEFLYPISPSIHYAFLNSRDRKRFHAAGLQASNSSLLPNPAPSPIAPSIRSSGTPLILYPSRAIRRKNLGELLLLAQQSPPRTRFAVTRSPENPGAKNIYQSWVKFASDHQLPIDFDVVDSANSFQSWVDRSTHFVTTSIAEGFGLTFLESIAFQKPLIGRDLSHVTAKSESLYQRILIPGDWIDPKTLRHHLVASLTSIHQLYRRPLNEDFIEQTFKSLHHGSDFDFGNLPESLQKSILIKLLENTDLTVLIQTSHGTETLRSRLAENFSLPARSSEPTISYAENLLNIYGKLAPQPTPKIHHLDPAKILDAYLTPEDFHFLLTPPPRIRAVIFDIYGTLLIAPSGGVRPDPAFDPILVEILKSHGIQSPEKPTENLHQAVLKHHRESPHSHPEVDLRELWENVLGRPVDDSLIEEIENAWHPSQPMPGAFETLHQLSKNRTILGVLSNAQINTLSSFGDVRSVFHPDLTLLSYQHLIAKPSPELFDLLAGKLAAMGIAPQETLFVGNDPLQDIQPAAATGFRTALFTGHPDSLRPGNCEPDMILESLPEISVAASLF